MVLDLDEYGGEEYRRWTLEARGGGTKIAFLSTVLEKDHGKVFWHQLRPEYDPFRNAIGCFALEKAGVTDYDLRSLFQMMFGVVSADAAKLLCSEYVFLSWKAGGIVTGDKIPNPSELAKLGVTLPPIEILNSDPEPGGTPAVQP
jgi:hypothetical protein